jgi:hypothetical protein
MRWESTCPLGASTPMQTSIQTLAGTLIGTLVGTLVGTLPRSCLHPRPQPADFCCHGSIGRSAKSEL